MHVLHTILSYKRYAAFQTLTLTLLTHRGTWGVIINFEKAGKRRTAGAGAAAAALPADDDDDSDADGNRRR